MNGQKQGAATEYNEGQGRMTLCLLCSPVKHQALKKSESFSQVIFLSQNQKKKEKPARLKALLEDGLL